MDAAAEAQHETIAFLSQGASYGLPQTPVERVETHWSIVFLVGGRAYKLKRGVAWSLLDYRTVERRERACRAELALNRRTAPDLYLAVRPICRAGDGTLRLGADGPAVDWVVVMRRFDQADLLDRRADGQRLAPETMRVLAAEIAAFHQAAEVTPRFGGAAAIGAAIERWHREYAEVAAVLEMQPSAAFHAAVSQALATAAPLLERRREQGKVRRCHGDLRLANICLLKGRPTLFDAVEFSDELSCIDVLYDLAFLLMDLDQRGLTPFAAIVRDRYLALTGDEDADSVLPLFLSLRSAQRAQMLASSALRRPDADAARRVADEARAHLAAAVGALRAVPAIP